MNNLLAASGGNTPDIPLTPGGGPLQGVGSLGNPGSNAVGIFSSFLTGIVGLLTVIAIIWFIFLMFTGALGILGSSGDQKALEEAKKRITYGVVGLVVVVAAISIILIAGRFVGIPNILDLNSLVNQLGL